MRILLAAQFFPPMIGGEERHVLNLATVLAARGADVAVATQQVPVDAPAVETLASGVRVHRLRSALMRLPGAFADGARPFAAPVPDPVLAGGLRRVVRAERPDVVHAHNWIVNSALPAARRVPLVLTLHDYSHVCATKRLMRDGAPCPGPAPTACLRCARGLYGAGVGTATVAGVAAMRPWKETAVDRLLTVSRAVAEGNGLVRRGIPHEVVPNFIPDALAGPLAPLAQRRDPALPDGPFLMFAGDLSEEKGVLTLLRAYAGLGPDRPGLLLVGRRTPDTPDTLPAGAVLGADWPHERVIEGFRRCLAAVLPSTWPDPCPTTVLEAMACGRPVITTTTGGMVDMVTDAASGLLVTPGDAPALTAALARVIGDPAFAARLGAGARTAVAAFTASAVATRLETIYRELLAAAPASMAGSAGTAPVPAGASRR